MLHLCNSAMAQTYLLLEIARKMGVEIDPEFEVPQLGPEWLIETGRQFGMRRSDEEDDHPNILATLLASVLPGENE